MLRGVEKEEEESRGSCCVFLSDGGLVGANDTLRIGSWSLMIVPLLLLLLGIRRIGVHQLLLHIVPVVGLSMVVDAACQGKEETTE